MIYDILPVNNYKGNLSNTVFDFNFYVENENQLSVSLVNSDGQTETLKYNVDYSVSEFKNKNGGFVTYPLENSKRKILDKDETLSIALVLPFSQETQFNNSSSLNLDSLEYSLDYLTRLIQIVSRKTDLCVKTIEGSNTTPEELINEIYQKIALFQAKYFEMEEKSEEFDLASKEAFEKIKEQLEEARKIGFYMENDKLFYVDSSGEKKEFRPNSTFPIGAVFSMVCSKDYSPKGALALDGAEYSKEQFEEFYLNFLKTGLIQTCSYEEYSSDLENFGQCAKFALDLEEEKFKVPYLKDGAYISQALSDFEIGKCYKETLPNIEFNLSNTPLGGVDSGIKITSDTSSVQASAQQYTGGAKFRNAQFKASFSSSIYQDSAKVQGDNIRLRYFVQVANGEINKSEMDWNKWASSLEGKLNKDHSNDEKPYIVEVSNKSILPSWYRIYSDGWVEQGGHALFSQDGTTITLLKQMQDEKYMCFWDCDSLASSSFGEDISVTTRTKESFTAHGYNAQGLSSQNAYWKVCGYINQGGD